MDPPLLPSRSADTDVTCHSCHFNRAMFADRKVLVTLCFHKLCNVCLARILRAGKGVCPKCGREIRQSDVQAQKFEDLLVDREVRVRKRMMRIFNKLLTDFRTPREYDDYLEMVESIIFNLANDIDVDETNARVEKYRRENQDIIDRNRARSNPETRMLDEMIRAEAEKKTRRALEIAQERQAELLADQERESAILNELASSNLSANDILRHYNQVAKQHQAQYSLSSKLNPFSGHKGHTFAALTAAGDGAAAAALMGTQDPWATLYTDESKDPIGPGEMLAQYHDSYTPGELHTDQAIHAGGYSVRVAYIRALEAAYSGLLVPPKP